MALRAAGYIFVPSIYIQIKPADAGGLGLGCVTKLLMLCSSPKFQEIMAVHFVIQLV